MLFGDQRRAEHVPVRSHRAVAHSNPDLLVRAECQVKVSPGLHHSRCPGFLLCPGDIPEIQDRLRRRPVLEVSGMPADKLLSGIAASACCGHIVIIAVFQYAGIPCFFRDNRIFHGKFPLLHLYRTSQNTVVPSGLSFFQMYTLYQDWTGKTIHICTCHPSRIPCSLPLSTRQKK